MRRSFSFTRLALLAGIGSVGFTSFTSDARAADKAADKADAKPAKSADTADAKPAKADAKPAKAATPKAEKGDAKGDKAAAKPDKKTRDAARKAYGEGEKAFAAGDFAAAYTGYARANELIPSPQANYWAAKSLDQGGKTDEAIAAYEAFLADSGANRAGDDKVSDAQMRVATLKASLVGELNVLTTPPGASLSVDGNPQLGSTPVVLKLAPGPHKLTVIAKGYDAKELDVDVKAGSKVDQQIDLVAHVEPVVEPAPIPETAPPPPPPPPPEKHSKVPAYVTLGIATGGAIMGTIFGVQALQSKSDYDSKPTTKSADDTERNALIADMAFGVAVTLGVTGIVLLTSSDDSGPTKAAQLEHLRRLPPKGTFRVTPYIGRESGGAAARLTF